MEGCFSTEEIIPNRRKVCAGMNFHGRNHPDSRESPSRDEFPRKKSSLIAGKSVEGCFSTEENISNCRKVCGGMLFHRKMHPCMEELLFQDALMVGKASLQDKKQISRCSSGQNGQSNQNNQRPERPERPEQSEQPAASENPAQPVTA